MREGVVGDAVGELRDDVRGGRGDDEEVGPVGEIDVARMPALFLVVEIGGDGMPREDLQGQGRDELLRVLRHDDADLVTAFDEPAREIGGLVGGDRAVTPRTTVLPEGESLTGNVRVSGEVAQAARAAAFPGEDGAEGREIGLAVGADEGVAVFGPVARFLAGGLEAHGELLLGFGATGADAVRDLGLARQEDEDIDEGRADRGIGRSADEGRALDVDVHEDVAPRLEVAEDLAFQGAVEAAVDLGMFEKVAPGDPGLEPGAVEEMVVDPVAFALARRRVVAETA